MLYQEVTLTPSVPLPLPLNPNRGEGRPLDAQSAQNPTSNAMGFDRLVGAAKAIQNSVVTLNWIPVSLSPSEMQMYTYRLDPSPTYPPAVEKACQSCANAHVRCDGGRPCGQCFINGSGAQCTNSGMGEGQKGHPKGPDQKGGNGVSLSLWHPLFSIVTRGIT